MEEHKPRNQFDIPAVFYFEVGNTHSGSRDHLRYQVKPEDGKLVIETWSEDVCYDIAKERGIISGTAEPPISPEGFQEMLAFLQQEYERAEVAARSQGAPEGA